MVMLALVVLGAYSYRLLPVEQMPEITIPNAFVTVAYALLLSVMYQLWRDIAGEDASPVEPATPGQLAA